MEKRYIKRKARYTELIGRTGKILLKNLKKRNIEAHNVLDKKVMLFGFEDSIMNLQKIVS